MAFPESVKAAAYRRAGGRCECPRSNCHGSGRCTARLGRHQGQFHHRRSLLAGGSDVLANSEHLCVHCHWKTGSHGG